MAQVTHDALALSEAERARLAETLIRSLDRAPAADLEQAWDAEIAARLARVRAGTAEGRPAEEVFRDLRARRQS